MEKNVGKKDAIVRIILAVVTVSIGLVLLNVQREVSSVLFIFSGMLIVTSMVGRCGLYKLFGINTCPLD
jgi:hypothetical protein